MASLRRERIGGDTTGLDLALLRAEHIEDKGSPRNRPSPVNRGKPGSKYHLICDGQRHPDLRAHLWRERV
jgi:hypothetical protein